LHLLLLLYYIIIKYSSWSFHKLCAATLLLYYCVFKNKLINAFSNHIIETKREKNDIAYNQSISGHDL
jgi:hypothetical protein